MTALIILCLSGSHEVYKVSCGLIASGVSVKNLLREREKLLFDRYCRELENELLVMENQSSNSIHRETSLSRIERRRPENLEVEFSEEAKETLSFQTADSTTIENINFTNDSYSLSSESLINSERAASFNHSNISSTDTRFSSFPAYSSRELQDSLKGAEICSKALDDPYHSFSDDLPNDSTIEEFAGKEEVVDNKLSTFIEIVDNEPVFIRNNIDELKEGEIVTITGLILKNCETFSINFLLANLSRDIALHINPRFPQSYIVRNSRVRDLWGIEEIASPLPFSLTRGKPFHIQVLIMSSSYLISINGRHFAAFSHRIPLKLVDSIEVKGDVEGVRMERFFTETYPEDIEGSEPMTIVCTPYERADPAFLTEKMKNRENVLSTPYYGRLAEQFDKGKRIQILGRIKMLPHSFYINLQSGHSIWPHPDIAFHFNPRFAKANIGKHVICKNAWYNGKWDKEEKDEIAADFRPGLPFNLEIVCHQQTYEVLLNSKLIAEFYFRLEPSKVDTIYIQGDIKIWNVFMSTIKLVKED